MEILFAGHAFALVLEGRCGGRPQRLIVCKLQPLACDLGEDGVDQDEFRAHGADEHLFVSSGVIALCHRRVITTPHGCCKRSTNDAARSTES
jgi:hypothetical protein